MSLDLALLLVMGGKSAPSSEIYSAIGPDESPTDATSQIYPNAQWERTYHCVKK